MPSSLAKLSGFGFCLCLLLSSPSCARWKYFRTGNEADKITAPQSGFALMGGGSQQEPAFQFLCERANGGDFLILRANTADDYAQGVDTEIKAICPLNSVATIIFTDREDSEDPKIPEIIDHAESIFFAGGDQSNYLRFWQDTPVQAALNRHIAAGKPIGGSSAGLAILGEFSFSSMIDTIHSPEALANPYSNKITLSRDFLRIPLLADTITDTHFVKRDRLGRLLVFMARIIQDNWAPRVSAIAVEENAAVLLEPDGRAAVLGGPAYFLRSTARPKVCRSNKTLQYDRISVHRAPRGSAFDLKSWKGSAGRDYFVSAKDGKVRSTSGASPY